MMITVSPYGWGTALPINIQVLLEDTASHLNRLMRDQVGETVIVVPAPCDDFILKDPLPPFSQRPVLYPADRTRQKVGISLHTSSPMSFVMSCLTMSVWQKDLTVGSTRQSAKQLRYSPSDAWPRDGHQVLRIPIGPITRDNWPVLSRTISQKKSVDYP